MTKTKLYARESVAFDHELVVRDTNGNPIDITGWTFSLELQRQAGSPDVSLEMASSGAEGLEVVDGPQGLLRMVVSQATLAAIGDTTGDFSMFGDLLGTPPSGSARFVTDVKMHVSTAGGEFAGSNYVVAVDAAAAQQVALAKVHADSAALSASLAESTSGPSYPDTVTGLAATSDGESFAVDNGDLTVTIYRNTAGSAVEQRTLATTEKLASGGGARLIGLLDEAPGAQVLDLLTLITGGPFVSILIFLTEAQRDDVKNYTGALDIRAAVQKAMDETWATNRNLYVPAGLYNVPGGVIAPGDSANRNRGWKMIGQGFGELFSRDFTNGTIFRSNVDAPVLRNEPDLVPAGVGAFEITGIRWEQTNPAATSEVIRFKSMYGKCSFHHNGVFQGGTGHGIVDDWSATGSISNNDIFGAGWVDGSANAAGSIGLFVRSVRAGNPLTGDVALTRVEGNTSRGFDWGYKIGDTAAGYDSQVINCAFRDNEDSHCNNGVWANAQARGLVISNHYSEAGQGGTGMKVEGHYTTIENSFIFFGFAKGIHRVAGVEGCSFAGNIVSLGNSSTAAPNPIGYDIEGDDQRVSIFGGALVVDHSSGGVLNARGIRIAGTNPRVDVIGVSFNPSGSWASASGSVKVDTSAVTGVVLGMIPGENRNDEMPMFAGGLALPAGGSLGDDDISGNTLLLKDGSFFPVAPTTPVTITAITPPSPEDGRIITIKANANLTIAASAFIKLVNGRSFSGDDNRIKLRAEQIGANTFWYEISRYLADGIASASKAAALDPATATAEDIVNALKNAGVMET